MSSQVRPVSLLEPHDREMLETPVPVVATFSFVGEAAYGELSYAKNDNLLIFCEDMSEGWSLGMLVDNEGNEIGAPGDNEGRPTLTRGLIARGFYEVPLQACDIPYDNDHFDASTQFRRTKLRELYLKSRLRSFSLFSQHPKMTLMQGPLAIIQLQPMILMLLQGLAQITMKWTMLDKHLKLHQVNLLPPH